MTGVLFSKKLVESLRSPSNVESLCNKRKHVQSQERGLWHKLRKLLNPLSANPTKWSNTLEQIVGCSRRIVWVGLTILQGWRLKG